MQQAQDVELREILLHQEPASQPAVKYLRQDESRKDNILTIKEHENIYHQAVAHKHALIAQRIGKQQLAHQAKLGTIKNTTATMSLLLVAFFIVLKMPEVNWKTLIASPNLFFLVLLLYPLLKFPRAAAYHVAAYRTLQHEVPLLAEQIATYEHDEQTHTADDPFYWKLTTVTTRKLSEQ